MPIITIGFSNQYSHNRKEIEIEWLLPFLPRENELFDLENLLPDTDEYLEYSCLSWSVDYVSWRTDINKNITPHIELSNEFQDK